MKGRVTVALRTAALLSAGALLLAVVAARPAAATVVRAMDFDAQCTAAARVFVGTVRAVESRRVVAAPAYYETIVTFAVEEVVAGAVASDVTLRFAGGEIDGVRQSIDGMPEFAAGERYVVLADAEHDPPLVSPVVGFNQGLYRVVIEDGPGGPRSVVRDRVGTPLAAAAVAAVGARLPVSRDSGAAPPEPELGAFLTAIGAARR